MNATEDPKLEIGWAIPSGPPPPTQQAINRLQQLADEESERWLPAVGFESLYEISNHARLKRVGKAARSGKGRGGGATIGRVLRDQPAPGGYRVVFLWRHGEQLSKLLHLVVAEAFIGPCPDGLEVNHADGNKRNNRPSNLEYMTHGQNQKHAYDTGLRRPSYRLTHQEKRRARELKMQGKGSRKIATILSCSRQTVLKALREVI